MVTVDIKSGQLESGYEARAFDEAYAALKKKGFRIISLAENAQLRIQQGARHDISQNGNWVLEDAVYIPGKGNFITRNSPININAVSATQAHREGKEFYLTQRQTDLALENSVKLPQRDITISTNRFGEEELTVFAFGGAKQAQAYGLFLEELGISEMPVYVVGNEYLNQTNQSFARKIWFGRLNGRSYLFGNCSYLEDGNFKVRGVKKS